jgi:hypothetical protein
MKKTLKTAQVGDKWPKNKWKSWSTRMYKIGKIGNPILIDKNASMVKIFVFGVKKYKFGWVRTQKGFWKA